MCDDNLSDITGGNDVTSGDINEGARRFDQFVEVEKMMVRLKRERGELEDFEFSADPVKAASQRQAQQELLMENEAERNVVINGALRGR